MNSDTIKSIPSPRLNKLEKLYVKVYLRTLSHTEAHKAVSPEIKNPLSNNSYSKRENVQFYISEGLEEKAQSFSLSSDTILQKLYKEATREGAGSNHSARIQALVQLGKHLGLFQEKKESTAPTIQIINYSDHKTSQENITEELIKEEITKLPDNIQIMEY